MFSFHYIQPSYIVIQKNQIIPIQTIQQQPILTFIPQVQYVPIMVNNNIQNKISSKATIAEMKHELKKSKCHCNRCGKELPSNILNNSLCASCMAMIPY
jgi:hypothetical protein